MENENLENVELQKNESRPDPKQDVQGKADLALPLFGVVFSWFATWVARLATGESIFIRDLFGKESLVTFSVGDILIIAGLVLGFLFKPLASAKGNKIAMTTVGLILIVLLVILSAVTRE